MPKLPVISGIEAIRALEQPDYEGQFVLSILALPSRRLGNGQHNWLKKLHSEATQLFQSVFMLLLVERS